MIKRINLASFFCRSLFLQKKCRILAIPVSTSTVYERKKETFNFENSKKEHFERDLSNYEDTFGDIESFEAKFQRVKDDPEDVLEYEKQKAAPGRTCNEYVNLVKDLLQKNDYKAAVKLLEVDMRNDRIKNPYFVYKVLITYNGYLGNVEEAYRLFTDYKKRGGIVSGAMYTSMFNACANCKNSCLALEKIEAVRECMNKNKFHKINTTNFNVMMKAYGRHGDLNNCLKIMDEIYERNEKVNPASYSFLLQACITDSNSGLRFALIVWRKMLQNNTKPSIYCFNTILRCIRDCQLGEVLLIPEAIKQIFEESKYFYKRKLKLRKIDDDDKEERLMLKIPSDGRNLIKNVNEKSELEEESENNFSNLFSIKAYKPEMLSVKQNVESCDVVAAADQGEDNLSVSANKDESPESYSNVEKNNEKNSFKLPNLLAFKPTMGSVVELNRMSTPQDRFVLVGGLNGFLKTMHEFGVKPNVKTFSLLLEVIPSTEEAEKNLISVAESYNVELDTCFFNILIKRRIFRKESHLVNVCLQEMFSRNLKPDILTFGILATDCTTHESGIELLKTIREHSFRVNSEIIGTLLKKAMAANDLKYVLTILKAAKEDEVKLDAKCLAKISHIVKEGKRRNLIENVGLDKIEDEKAQELTSQK